MPMKKEGSITVFLTLILLLVLSIIMTTLEAARANGARIYTKRALQTAMDSVLSEYYLPLFQEYHIFGLDGSYGTDHMNLERVTGKLKDYMEYTFNPGLDLQDFWGNSYSYMNLYGINTDKITVNEPVTLMDYDGDIFVNQAVDYMKYKEVSNGIEKFLPAVNSIEETQKAQAALEEKQKTEKILYEIDKRLLSLMRSIDGINITEKGVRLNRNGNINILDNFVKKIQNNSITQANVGIHNDLVYNSLKNYYVEPRQILDAATKDIDALYDNAIKKEEARKRYESLLAIDRSSIEDSDQLSDLQDAISNARETLDSCERKEKELIKSCNNHMKTLQDLVEGSLSAIKRSKEIIEELIPLQEEATHKLQDYETFLTQKKDELNQDFYQSLQDDLSGMEKYKGIGKGGSNSQYDFVAMKSTLNVNESILLNVKSDTNVGITSDKESWSRLKQVLSKLKTSIKNYNSNSLTFDYSTLSKPVDSESFFSGIKTMLQDGIMGLVVEDIDKVSKKEISKRELPSQIYKIQSNDEPGGFLDSIFNIDLSGADKYLSQFTDDCGKELNMKDTAYNAVEDIGKILLLQEYLIEHYKHYDETALSDELKVLDYELEYIIMGKTSDYDNLKGVITRILLIRMAVNLIALLSDRNSSEEARLLAVAFVGFTGMPALVEITKMVILTVWSLVESLVDIKALIQGKTLPFLKKGSDIQMKLYEIFNISKGHIKSKADGIKDNNTLMGLSYVGYLKIFMYLEKMTVKSYRAMDIIQENLQLKYEDSFYIKNCIFGFGTEADFEMKSKFINFSFMRKILDHKEYRYRYHTVLECSY